MTVVYLRLQASPELSVSDLSLEERSTVRVFQDTTPSVVNITNVAAVRSSSFSLDIRKIPLGTGSGFIWDNQGHVVTNFHVIKGASEVRVTTLDQKVYTASIVGGDPDKDIAVLRLDSPPDVARKLKPTTLGTSANLLVGQKVYAIGNPFGLDHTLTQGIISGLGRELDSGMNLIKGVIQTDAAINPGNSGGVLLDSRGRVIGINTAIADPTGKGASSGVGFAIPIDSVKGLVDQILKFGQVIRPVLGVSIAPPTLAKQLGLEGVVVLEVTPGSGAEKAGMQASSYDRLSGRLRLGDVIVGIDGRPVRNYRDLYDILDDKRVGQTVQVDVLRNEGTIETLALKLGGRAAMPGTD
eukprot:evm.model.scf_4818.1 EVM.evm.TU.scf_4818.1   scf_4818:151-3522(+)